MSKLQLNINESIEIGDACKANVLIVQTYLDGEANVQAQPNTIYINMSNVELYDLALLILKEIEVR